MTNFVERRAFNLMGMFDGLEEYLNTGDPAVREWFLVKSNFWPIFLCSMYLLTIKVIGPSFMRDRKPFELRKIMMVYNIFLVASYAACVSVVGYGIAKTGPTALCRNTEVTRKDYTHVPEIVKIEMEDAVMKMPKMAVSGWVIYLLKYAEFLDTIFFVLRKKDRLITNLHVIHHASLPICGWIFFRTERSGFQAYPILINSFVHIAMYSYYTLAAMGPKVRKYLWWKRYLTIAQMIQFILIIAFVTVVMPMTGCTAANSSIYINVVAAALFFALFYNFYQNSFKPTKSTRTSQNGNSKTNGTNGKNGNGESHHHNGNNGCSNGDNVSNSDNVNNGQSKIKSN